MKEGRKERERDKDEKREGGEGKKMLMRVGICGLGGSSIFPSSHILFSSFVVFLGTIIRDIIYSASRLSANHSKRETRLIRIR